MAITTARNKEERLCHKSTEIDALCLLHHQMCFTQPHQPKGKLEVTWEQSQDSPTRPGFAQGTLGAIHRRWWKDLEALTGLRSSSPEGCLMVWAGHAELSDTLPPVSCTHNTEHSLPPCCSSSPYGKQHGINLSKHGNDGPSGELLEAARITWMLEQVS